MFNKILAIIFLSIVVLPQTVWSAGISVKPSQLDFSGQTGQVKADYIKVSNLSDQPVIFRIYIDEFADQFNIKPNDFRLEVGEERKVKVSVSLFEAGIMATNLSIIAQDLDRRNFNVATGVKVPVRLEVSGEVSNGLSLNHILIGLGVLVAFIVIVVVVRLVKPRKWWHRLGDHLNFLKPRKKPWWKIYKIK